MKIREITDKLEAFAPLTLAEEWDNPGLTAGTLDKECTGVTIALDLTLDAIAQAKENGCNLIITHHPAIFGAIKKVETDKTEGALIEALLKNGITAYAAHTNVDKAFGGISFKIAEILDGSVAEGDGIGVKFTVEPITLDAFARKIAYKLADKTVRVSGDPDTVVTRVFVISGGGASNEAYERARAVADVFVTGDIKHHIFVASNNDGFPVIEFSHYSSEIIVSDIIYNVLKPFFGDLKIIKAIQQCPYRTLEEI